MSDQLKPSQLTVDLSKQALGFKSTNELEALNAEIWLGQDQAKKAATFGLSLFKPSFNVLVLGDSGSGRQSLTWQLIESISETRAKPKDCWWFPPASFMSACLTPAISPYSKKDSRGMVAACSLACLATTMVVYVVVRSTCSVLVHYVRFLWN